MTIQFRNFRQNDISVALLEKLSKAVVGIDQQIDILGKSSLK